MILQVLSTGAAWLRRFRQDARRLPIPVTAPAVADTLPGAGPVGVASGRAAGGDPSGACRAVAVIGRGGLERSGPQSLGIRQTAEPASRRLQGTVAVERRAGWPERLHCMDTSMSYNDK